MIIICHMPIIRLCLPGKKDEVPIGAVIAHEGAIITSAYNQTRSTNDPSAHAEMLAIHKPLIISGLEAE